jgi:hypothetical protein
MREKQSDAMFKYMKEQPNTYGEINYMINNSLEIDPRRECLAIKDARKCVQMGPIVKPILAEIVSVLAYPTTSR